MIIKFLSVILIMYLVPLSLTIIASHSKKSTTKSIFHFVMRPVKDLAILGFVCAVFFGGLGILAAYTGESESPGFIWLFAPFLLLALLLLLAPCPHFWDVYVDGNDIISYRVFIKWRTMRVSEIEYCIQNRGGIHLYKDGKKIISIDGFSHNIENFKKRMIKEKIDIRLHEELAGY